MSPVNWALNPFFKSEETSRIWVQSSFYIERLTNVKVNYEARKCPHEVRFSVAAFCWHLQEPANTEEAL